MKNSILLVSMSFILFSCGGKEAKKEIVLEKKVETVTTPVIKKEEPKPTLIFTVQIGAFKKQNLKLSSLENVQISSEDNMYKYRLGAFKTYQEATSYRKIVLSKFPGAFVQAVKNNHPIAIQEALK